jgi:hypothetical protein
MIPAFPQLVMEGLNKKERKIQGIIKGKGTSRAHIWAADRLNCGWQLEHEHK